MTDRRAFGERMVADELLTRLRRTVEDEGAYLHVVRRDQTPMLATSTARAGEPYLVVRLGYGDAAEPPAPRRDPADVIEFGE